MEQRGHPHSDTRSKISSRKLEAGANYPSYPASALNRLVEVETNGDDFKLGVSVPPDPWWKFLRGYATEAGGAGWSGGVVDLPVVGQQFFEAVDGVGRQAAQQVGIRPDPTMLTWAPCAARLPLFHLVEESGHGHEAGIGLGGAGYYR